MYSVPASPATMAASTRLVDLDALLRRFLGPAPASLTGSVSGKAGLVARRDSGTTGTLHSMNWADGSHHGSPPAHPAPAPACFDLENIPYDNHLAIRRLRNPS
ncbi:hypothetical protein GTC6_15601 [Gordonia terrae C-6]|uniref:Uncharacterized protein n=1 Tax=Gordonia terrae C-6 TaxID=1316928 RepID=R7Y794_9ACTN|nr:hypothetical protein [Gordonia terrae]EON31870.1 hypothetical protein GTC6_15601 [Gordonia terrae C-6]